MGLVAGVIGCGKIAKFHADGLAAAGADVRWVCDPAPEATAAWRERFGARVASDPSDILADPEVRCVHLLTPSAFRRDAALAVLDAGKALVCEKTLDVSAENSLAITRRAREKKSILYTAYMKRYLPVVRRAKELLTRLGDIVSMHIRARQYWGIIPWREIPADHPYRGDPPSAAKSGGGVLPMAGSHIIDLVHHFMGRPSRVYARIHTPRHTTLDLHTAALMETPSGPVLFETLGHGLLRLGPDRDGWDERLEITGLQGRLELFTPAWNDPGRAGLLRHHDGGDGRVTEYRFAPESPFTAEIVEFHRDIARGRQEAQGDDTGYVVDEVIEHLRRSAATGQAIDVAYRL